MDMPFLWWLPFGKVPEISPEDLARRLKSGNPPQLVDARTGMEYEAGTIAGARHAPVTGMPASIERLDLDYTRSVVVLCQTGHRSRPGTRWLRARGVQAFSLQGGISAWVKAGLALENPDRD